MKLKDIFTSSFFLKSIFALSLFILIFISAVSYKHTTSLTNSTEALIHSYNVRNELELLMSHLKDAETGQRGFFISHDSTFLAPYLGARKKVDRSLYILKKLAQNNVRQQRNIDTLYDLISLKFLYLSKSLQYGQNYFAQELEVNKNMTKGEEVMDSIRVHTNEMVNLEISILKEKQKKLENEISFTPLFTLLLLLFSLFVFFASYLKINNNIEFLKESNAQLLIQTASMLHAEKIGKFSTWHWDLSTNKIVFSESQGELLGLESGEPNLTNEKFITFIHPEDRSVVLDGLRKVKAGQKPSNAFYRILKKDGEQRYFNTIGKIITDKNGKKTLIGINTDVTEQYKKSLSLEERNLELEQTNTELASFNYVASHDLQEPLRIIQTYISRIAEREQHTLTETGKDYFERIQSSANRMQILINDLLLFSRTNKIEKVFEWADLNELLENARLELLPVIEEKKALIQSDHLPSLKVISFQIQQLLINLINNSLKYSKPGIPPVVRISYKEVTGKEVPLQNADPQKEYGCLVVEDNGLGFDQQYAENIFVLFKRLHHKNEYPGTGIGLSICKKIADNHSGFITAKGKPGIGAIFTLSIPLQNG